MISIVLRILFLASLALWPAAPAYARGGGGCIEEGTFVFTPSGLVPVERLRSGDIVLGASGYSILPVTVRSITRVETNEFYELVVSGTALRLTAEHPVETAPGVFRVASHLKPGDRVMVSENGRMVSMALSAVVRVRSSKPAYNLLVSPAGTFFANSIIVHNKGCFLPDTLVRRADGTEVPISGVRHGDELLAFTADERVTTATVRQVLTHEVDEYRVVRTENMVLKVTSEHPFYIGDGTFKTLEVLRPGDTIYAYDGFGLSPQRIESVDGIFAPTCVYNLMTDAPHTFFANGIAVHNKGGGGCFAEGTPVLTPRGEVPIERVRPGDRVIAVDSSGGPVSVRVKETHSTRSPVIVLQTTRGGLSTTSEHPVAVGGGGYRNAGDLAPGEKIMAWRDNGMMSAVVTGKLRRDDDEPVYNLTVEAPHTFIAGGFVVHNKGGGGGGFHGGGSRSSGGSSRPMTKEEGRVFAIFVIGTVIIFGIVVYRRTRKENLDQLFSRADIEKKSEKTEKLIQFISQQDAAFEPGKLRKMTDETFRKLQQCWQAREYEPMRPLLMPDLYTDHLGQIRGMVRNHEINRIEALTVDAVDLVNVRYTLKKEDREFTALITATATDYYVDDRTNERLRGDRSPAQFQEFWTFQYHQDTWLLREIEQTAESDILNDDNFFEQFTDRGVSQAEGPAAGQQGPEGPWLEGPVMVKERRIERMLNFLVKTDSIWDRRKMLLLARSAFLSVTGAWEAGDPATVPSDDLFPELARHLRENVATNRVKGVTLEFRNLAVRKVELVLVRNFADNSRDEYVARVRAHAKKVMKVAGSIVRQDDDVTAFEEYLTFGRYDGKWRLKEIELPHEAGRVVEQENVDQEASKQQIEWYYQHKRAM